MVRANTVGTIAKKTGAPIHQVEYLIRSRGIMPEFRAGIARVFSDAAVAQIEREVKAMRKRQQREVVPA